MEIYQLFRALGDETRLKILDLLLERSYCGRALARKLAISEAAVSQHLKVLREAGLLDGQKCGYYRHYTVNQLALAELAQELNERAQLECRPCSPEAGGCAGEDLQKCRSKRPGCASGQRKACCRHNCGSSQQAAESGE